MQIYCKRSYNRMATSACMAWYIVLCFIVRSGRHPTLIYMEPYEKFSRGLLGREQEEVLESELSKNPELGMLIPGTGGVRKIRLALQGRGKSGGLRIIYYYNNSTGRIYIITAYPKNVKANLSQAEKNMMKKFTRELEESP